MKELKDVICKECGKTFKSQYNYSKCDICRVKKSRHDRKKRAIIYKGGKCIFCGYNKCDASLDFHHVDPKIKEMQFSASLRYSWETIKQELDKCVLVCKNCHGEIHWGIFKIPEDIEKVNYNNKVENSSVAKRVKKLVFCKICNNQITSYSKFQKCTKCSAKSREKIEWPSLEVLKEKVKLNGYCATGRELGVSDNAVSRHIKKIEENINVAQ